MIYYQWIETPIGKWVISEKEGAIIGVDRTLHQRQDKIQEKKTELLEEAIKQLAQYFDGSRTQFELPLRTIGTSFQRQVWEALLSIPYGETKSYGDIAKQVGNPMGARAVGGANNKNPIAIIIPCHRVISSDGKLGGYAGGVELKEALLRREQKIEL